VTKLRLTLFKHLKIENFNKVEELRLMYFYPISDLHAEQRSPIAEEFKRKTVRADCIFAAGDIHVQSSGPEVLRQMFPKQEICYVPGNHEYYGATFAETERRLRIECQKYGLHFLQCDTVVINGVRIAGCTLWTDLKIFDTANVKQITTAVETSLADYRCIFREDSRQRPIDARQTQQVHRQQLAWLRQQKADVIITHHCPSLRCSQLRYRSLFATAAFVSDLETDIARSGAKYWICGHTHMNFDFKINQTRVLSNCVGYPTENIQGFSKDRRFEV
jgi:predicted phosphodiesterase